MGAKNVFDVILTILSTYGTSSTFYYTVVFSLTSLFLLGN